MLSSIQKIKGNLFLTSNFEKEPIELEKSGYEKTEKDGKEIYQKVIQRGKYQQRIIYDEYGSLEEYGRFKEDKKDGWFIYLHTLTFIEGKTLYGLTEGCYLNNEQHGVWYQNDFYDGKRIIVKQIETFRKDILHGKQKYYQEDYDKGHGTFLYNEVDYVNGEKHGKEIYYSSFNKFTGKGYFPIRIENWERGKFISGTKFDLLDGSKMNDYFEEWDSTKDNWY